MKKRYVCLVCGQEQWEVQGLFGATEYDWRCSHSEEEYRRMMEEQQDKQLDNN